MIAINIIEANDAQLQMLVNKASKNGYNKWSNGKEFTVESIKEYKCDIIYLEYDFTVQYSSLSYAQVRNVKLITIQEYIAMKKSDLKPGMVVEYVNGERRLVVSINNKLYLISSHMFAAVKSFSDDLKCDSNSDRNIVKVYQPEEASSLTSLLNNLNNCIWERPKETVLTMQEIADKFGIPVEQLKIKK